MQKRSSVSYFLVFLILSLLILSASKIGLLNPLDSFLKDILSPVQAFTYQTFAKISGFDQNAQIKALKTQNLALTQQLIDQNKLIGDNKALRDQFQTASPKSSGLIPADVVGAPGFIPGLSVPEILILDRGVNDGVKTGDAVVYENNLIGGITQVTANLSMMTLLTNSSSLFTAKTLETGAQGVVKGQGGGEVVLDNVVLSDSLKKDDLVLTNGNVNLQNSGFPPDLTVGKIISISKNPSDLFQKADIQPLVSFNNLKKVFVVVNYR
ncbi:MAG: rod shape-determining protein MreC [Candidatus Levyibacteriota bacterium]|jgi:rod shape-determining protein MreC